MERTQVYLSLEERALLDQASSRTGASRSELIRRAIRERYGAVDFEARRAALHGAAGSWTDRDFTGADYVDTIRDDLDERLRELGLA